MGAALNTPTNIYGSINTSLRSPLYHQIFVLLRNGIDAGTLADGEMLPGEVDLAQQFGVSRITARRAMDELAAAGLVRRERGRGTHITAPRPATAVRASVEDWRDAMTEMSDSTRARLLSFENVAATRDVAEALQVAEGETVQRSVRIRSADAEPLSYLIAYLPQPIADSVSRAELESRSLLFLIERTGATIATARQTITATLAEPDVAAALQTHAGAPLLRIDRRVFDANRTPVQYIRVFYRPDRYRLEMELTCTGAGS
jgi:GntR family transcriptional regulator